MPLHKTVWNGRETAVSPPPCFRSAGGVGRRADRADHLPTPCSTWRLIGEVVILHPHRYVVTDASDRFDASPLFSSAPAGRGPGDRPGGRSPGPGDNDRRLSQALSPIHSFTFTPHWRRPVGRNGDVVALAGATTPCPHKLPQWGMDTHATSIIAAARYSTFIEPARLRDRAPGAGSAG